MGRAGLQEASGIGGEDLVWKPKGGTRKIWKLHQVDLRTITFFHRHGGPLGGCGHGRIAP